MKASLINKYAEDISLEFETKFSLKTFRNLITVLLGKQKRLKVFSN